MYSSVHIPAPSMIRQQRCSTSATTATSSARPARSFVKTTTVRTRSGTTTRTVTTTIRVRSEADESTKPKDTKVKHKSSQLACLFGMFTQLLYKGLSTPQEPPVKVDYFKVPYQWLITVTFTGEQSTVFGQPYVPWTVCACIYLEDLRGQLHLGIELKKQNAKQSQVTDITEADGPKCFARHAYTFGSRSSPEQSSWYSRAYLVSRDYWMRKAEVFNLVTCETLDSIEVYKAMPDSPFSVASSDDQSWTGDVSMPDNAELVYDMATEEDCWSERTKKGYKRVAETMQNRAVLVSLFGAAGSVGND